MEPDFAIRSSALLAKKIERRPFLRKTAAATFTGGLLVSTGVISVGTFLFDPSTAEAADDCPSGCGPSPCCDTGVCSGNSSCCAYGQGNTAICLNNNACVGPDSRTGYWNGTNSCWSCSGHLCCDCKTYNPGSSSPPKWCPNSENINRCICWKPG
jgi:hypothetical protein